jgi:mannose/fructose/N-acetylgalactosamine-specific phosphotransferase system component IIC
MRIPPRRSPAGLWFNGKNFEWESAMDNAIRNPMFVTGALLAIVGLGVCLNRLLRGDSVGYLAFGLFVSGCTLLLVGWMQRNK